MLRIEIVEGQPNTVRVAGRLVGAWVPELRDVIAAQPTSSVVELDLTDVTFVDADGVALLRDLTRGGIVNLRCAAFVAVQLAS